MSFSEDWSQILKLQKEFRQIHHYRQTDWGLRVYLYQDCEGVGSQIFHKDQAESWDDYHPRIDGFFPLFKADLKEYLKEIYELLNENKEEEAEDLLVAIPEFLKELRSVHEC